jgi:hypothetical protein
MSHPFITAELVRGRRAELQADVVNQRSGRLIRHAADATVVRSRRQPARIRLARTGAWHGR